MINRRVLRLCIFTLLLSLFVIRSQVLPPLSATAESFEKSVDRKDPFTVDEQADESPMKDASMNFYDTVHSSTNLFTNPDFRYNTADNISTVSDWDIYSDSIFGTLERFGRGGNNSHYIHGLINPNVGILGAPNQGKLQTTFSKGSSLSLVQEVELLPGRRSYRLSGGKAGAAYLKIRVYTATKELLYTLHDSPQGDPDGAYAYEFETDEPTIFVAFETGKEASSPVANVYGELNSIRLEAIKNLVLEPNSPNTGSPTSDRSSLFSGETARIQANPAKGYHFVRWEILSGEGSFFKDKTKEETTFTMGMSDTVVRAVYEKETLNVETKEIEVPLGTDSKSIDVTELITSVTKEPSGETVEHFSVEEVDNFNFMSVGEKEVTLKVMSDDLTKKVSIKYRVLWQHSLGILDHGSTLTGLSLSLLLGEEKPRLRAGFGEVTENILDHRTFSRGRFSLYRENTDTQQLELTTTTVFQSKKTLVETWNKQLEEDHAVNYGDVVAASVHARDSVGSNITSQSLVHARNERLEFDVRSTSTGFYMLTTNGFRFLRVNELTTNRVSVPWSSSAEEMAALAPTFFRYPSQMTEEEKEQLTFDFVRYDDTTIGGNDRRGTIAVTQTIPNQGSFTVNYEVFFTVNGPLTFDSVPSSIDFGSLTYGARTQRVEEAKLDKALAVSDMRSDTKNGWTVSATLVSPLTNESGKELPTALRYVYNGKEKILDKDSQIIYMSQGNKERQIRISDTWGTEKGSDGLKFHLNASDIVYTGAYKGVIRWTLMDGQP